MLSPRSGSLACAIVGISIAVAGCGTAARPITPVQLVLAAPVDGTRVTNASVAISGTVSPAGASVLVLGQRVTVRHGAFSAQVSLQPGTNIIDVMAGAPRAPAAMAAVRVFRQVLVSVPNLVGDSPSDATSALRARGLVARTRDNDGFLGALIPTSPSVCSTTPPGGRQVLPGSPVTVTVSKTC
jgi:hypothetical protein